MRIKAMLRRAMRGVAPLFLLAAACAAGIAGAQAPDGGGQPGDGSTLPTRVGRVSNFSGEIYHAPAERATDWETIGLNFPVTSGDNLWVADNGRAEIDFGGGQLRMASATNVNVAQLDDHNLGLFVAQGHVSVRIRTLDAGDTVVVDTPSTQVQLTRTGLYGIDVNADNGGFTTVTVRQGQAVLLVANGAQQVFPGQTAVVQGNDPTQADVRTGIASDGFDTWIAERDRYYARASNTNYVSGQMVGYADLQQYGTWQTAPDVGPVWYPTTVAAGWSPYSDGYWTNTAGFGLTWVDAAPWGYAPFHYGRWSYYGNRWGWAPGSYVERPVWAPALVAWTGGNGWNVGVSVGGPVYGWVPLGWSEPYRPSWSGCGAGCWNRYNQPYNVNVTYNNFYRNPPPPSNYANWRVPGAVMAVSGAAIASRAPLNRERIALTPAALTAAPVLREPIAVKPLVAPANLARPGTRGTPKPASQFYATSKPAQMGLKPGVIHTMPGAPNSANMVDRNKGNNVQVQGTPGNPAAGGTPNENRLGRVPAPGTPGSPSQPGKGTPADFANHAPGNEGTRGRENTGVQSAAKPVPGLGNAQPGGKPNSGTGNVESIAKPVPGFNKPRTPVVNEVHPPVMNEVHPQQPFGAKPEGGGNAVNPPHRDVARDVQKMPQQPTMQPTQPVNRGPNPGGFQAGAAQDAKPQGQPMQNGAIQGRGNEGQVQGAPRGQPLVQPQGQQGQKQVQPQGQGHGGQNEPRGNEVKEKDKDKKDK